MLCQASLLCNPEIWPQDIQRNLQMQRLEVSVLTQDGAGRLRKLKKRAEPSISSHLPTFSSSSVMEDKTNWQNKQADYPKSFFL